MQIYRRICRPSAVNGRAAGAARPTCSRLPAALDRATGPGERCHWCAAAAEMEDFPCCRPSCFVSSDGLKSHRASSRGVAHVPVSAACGIHTCCWCVLQSRGGDLHSTLLLNFRLRRHESTLLIPFQGALLVLFSRRFLATGLGVKTGF